MNFLNKLIKEFGEEDARRLYSLGVDNNFKLEIFKQSNLEDAGNYVKLSYPNSSNQFYYQEYEMEKWEVAFQKYSMFKRLNYPDTNIEHFLSKNLFQNKDELNNFLKWAKNKFESKNLYKLSSYGFGLPPNTHQDPAMYNLPGSSFRETDDSIVKAREFKAKKEESESKVRKNILRSLNSILKAIQDSSIPYSTYEKASEYLFPLIGVMKENYSPRMQKDAFIRVNKSLNKLGLKKYANEIEKLAQEIPQENTPAAAPAATENQTTPTAPEQNTNLQNQTPAEPETAPADPEPVDIKTIEGPGPRPEDYSSFNLEGVTIEDAAKKLDDVAATLADRRVIRMLAEFDIMLDTLGIASMFPELAESQSKLIDSFSYALTRVSKMMGQISQAKTLIDAADRIPGSDTVRDMISEEEPTETNNQI